MVSATYKMFRWRDRGAIGRIGRAIRYAANRMSEDDASVIIYECQPASGWFPLETFSVQGVLDGARDRWGDIADLPALARQASERVWYKWSSTGASAAAAEDWAFDLIAEYAAEDNIPLVDQWDVAA